MLPALLLLSSLFSSSDRAAQVAPAAAAAASADGGVVIVPIEGPLSEKMVALTIRAIRKAHEIGAQTLVFEINTEGGDVELMDRLIDEIEGHADDLLTVAFVTQKAASAGALIAISCQRLYMKPATNIGSALPIMVPQIFGVPLGAPQTVGSELSPLDEKILGHYRGHFRTKAQAHHRPPALAEAMVYAKYSVYEVEVEGVRQFVSEAELPNLITEKGEASIRKLRDVCKKGDVLNLTAQEALNDGFIDGLAASQQDLFDQLGLTTAATTTITPSWSEHLVDFTQSYGALLLVLGLIAVFVEIKVPGFGLPGILGTLLLGLYLFGKYLAGLADFTEILLIVAGFGMIAVEIFVMPGSLVAGILGVIALVAGLALASQETFLPQPDTFAEAAWWANVRTLSFSLTAVVAGMIIVAHYFPNIPFLNRAVLRSGTGAAPLGGTTGSSPVDELDSAFRPAPGTRGTARTVLRPAGKVEIEGRELDAVSEGPLVEAGRRVVILRVEAGHVVVRRDETA